jgi:mannose-6-phosphate isomerase-like protein (cupin superfamily)
MPNTSRIVRNRDLEPTWTVLRAKEPGFMRSLITWMGGPEGYINTNPGVAIESRQCAVGLMEMGSGQRQPGVHTHSMVEIYVILDGMVESFDGIGNKHIAGPLDCLYIPKGVPHGVRTVGDKPVKLLWVNDAIEKWGVSHYQEGPGPHPAENGQTVALVRFNDLEPSWAAPRAKEAGFLRWSVSWVGSASHATGTNFNPDLAQRNGRVAVSLTVVLPANRLPRDETAQGDRLLVITRGRAILGGAREGVEIDPLDAVFCPAGSDFDLRALDGEPLYCVMVQAASSE